MAITNYAELKTAVTSWLKRTDLAADISNFIALGELRINRRLRLRGMEATASLAISLAGEAVIPTNLLSLKTITLNDANSTPLERVTPINFFARRENKGTPAVFTQVGNQYLFSPVPTSAIAVNCIYYAAPVALSDIAPTNWFMSNAPDALLWAALAEAAPFMLEDPRISIWESKLEAAFQALEGVECVEAMSGAVPTIRRI